jgi:hypothetical protein
MDLETSRISIRFDSVLKDDWVHGISEFDERVRITVLYSTASPSLDSRMYWHSAQCLERKVIWVNDAVQLSVRVMALETSRISIRFDSVLKDDWVHGISEFDESVCITVLYSTATPSLDSRMSWHSAQCSEKKVQ